MSVENKVEINAAASQAFEFQKNTSKILPNIKHNSSNMKGIQRNIFNKSQMIEASQITTDTNISNRKTLHRFVSPSSKLYDTQNSFMQTF